MLLRNYYRMWQEGRLRTRGLIEKLHEIQACSVELQVEVEKQDLSRNMTFSTFRKLALRKGSSKFSDGPKKHRLCFKSTGYAELHNLSSMERPLYSWLGDEPKQVVPDSYVPITSPLYGWEESSPKKKRTSTSLDNSGGDTTTSTRGNTTTTSPPSGAISDTRHEGYHQKNRVDYDEMRQLMSRERRSPLFGGHGQTERRLERHLESPGVKAVFAIGEAPSSIRARYDQQRRAQIARLLFSAVVDSKKNGTAAAVDSSSNSCEEEVLFDKRRKWRQIVEHGLDMVKDGNGRISVAELDFLLEQYKLKQQQPLTVLCGVEKYHRSGGLLGNGSAGTESERLFGLVSKNGDVNVHVESVKEDLRVALMC